MWTNNQLRPEDLQYFVRDARDYALTQGSVMRQRQVPNDNCLVHVPFALFPSPFPRKLYETCLDIQPSINKLMLSIARDTNFMENTLSPLTRVDDFTKNLLDLNRAVMQEGLAQPIISCISRSDYMLTKLDSMNDLSIRQVEMNAIASSMSALSVGVQSMHQHLLTKYRLIDPENLPVKFPKNDSLELVSNGLIEGHDLYGKKDAFVLLVAEDRTLNISDHYSIDVSITRARPDVRIVRRSFRKLAQSLKLGPNKELILDGCKEISFVYYRNCYDPSNYDFPESWPTRLLIERSRAIKCPSISFHLSGAKKFQQVLTSQQKLEQFLSPAEAEQVSQVFCNFWSLDPGNAEGEAGFQRGLSDPKDLVLKPQREGGGHNIFGEEIKSFLKQLEKDEDRLQYILMEYIKSPHEKNWLLLNDDLAEGDQRRLFQSERLISELGIYGSIFANGTSKDIPLSNKAAGYLVRSKRFGVHEGGVAAGYAGISSLALIEDKPNCDYSHFYHN